MADSLNPTTLRPVPEEFSGIYAHSTSLDKPSKLVILSGQVGVARDGTVPAGFSGQCHLAMDHVEGLLQAHKMSLNDVMKVTYYLTRTEDLPELIELRQTRWHTSNPPAVTTLFVAGLVSPDWFIEIEVLAGI